MPKSDWMAELGRTVECVIGLNVDCGGADGVYRVRDAVLEAIEPHTDAAFQRGLMAGRSQAGYRLIQENERLRRELELAHQSKRREGVCPTCLSALSVVESATSAGEA